MLQPPSDPCYCLRCSYLLDPLLKLDKERTRLTKLDEDAGPPLAAGPSVLLLLDALDEADDGNQGCGPVAALIAKE